MESAPSPARPTWVEVDLDAIAHNVTVLRAHVAPADLWAVVKADAYGHGAAAVARQARASGAAGLAVALVEEAEELRAAGLEGPILLLSEPPVDAVDRAVEAAVEPAVYSALMVEAIGPAAAAADAIVEVHVKVDTGMHRVGATAAEAVEVARAVDAHPALRLGSVWTHLAVADEPDHGLTAVQLARFDDACAAIEEAGVAIPRRHAANSAGAIAHPAARHDLVRVGIALYGLDASPALSGVLDLHPALRLVSRVSQVKEVPAGAGISYGQRYRVDAPTTIATVPVGYADGLRRALGRVGGEVLVRGRRHPIAGTVTMDQIMVDLGPDSDVQRGEEVVLLGRQGDEEVRASEWAALLDTIDYEVTCGLGARLPRRHVRGGRSLPG